MTFANARRSASSRAFSRRTLVGSSLAAATLWPLGAAPAAARQETSTTPLGWRPWLLDTVDELRPAAPPDPTPSEIEELLDLQGRRTDETMATIRHWTSRPSVVPWTELAAAALDEFLSPTQLYRANGLLQVAMVLWARRAVSRAATATASIGPPSTSSGARRR